MGHFFWDTLYIRRVFGICISTADISAIEYYWTDMNVGKKVDISNSESGGKMALSVGGCCS